MSNKRNRQPVVLTPPPQGDQSATQQEQQEDQQEQQGQDDQEQDQASQDTGTEQQSSDQAAQQEQPEQATEKETPTPPPAPVVQEKPVEKPVAPAPKPTQQGFTPVYNVQLELANYAEAMDKKNAIVPEDGGKWQYSLFSTLKKALSAKDQEAFNNEWNTALVFFHQNKDGIFNENFIFRFPEQWPGSSSEFVTFRRLVYMMLQTADAKGRKAALQNINMELVVDGLKQDQRTRLLNFYEV